MLNLKRILELESPNAFDGITRTICALPVLRSRTRCEAGRPLKGGYVKSPDVIRLSFPRERGVTAKDDDVLVVGA